MESSDILSRTWTSCPSQLCSIRKNIAKSCALLSYTKEETNLIVLAIDEACSNIMRYAYKNCTDGEILVVVSKTDNQVVIKLHDYAKKVSEDCIKAKPSSPLKPGGLGLSLIYEIMDSVQFVDTEKCTGNILEMRKNLPKENT
ncbi:MAG: serine/threonine-protein kinase RsbW [Enterobacterales bacterium]|jgi:serine/threonine-protein kinase RsbW